LEDTNKSYALAKLSGAQLVENVAKSEDLAWRTLILSNLYGPRDHFESDRSHLIAAVINKVSQAKSKGQPSIDMWGTGNARREFTFADDVANFIVSNIEEIARFPIYLNLGSGIDYSVQEYYSLILSAFEYECRVIPKVEMPSGMMRKLMNVKRAEAFGWKPATNIQVGLKETVQYYLQSKGADLD
jgi:GDP-L-fucose synthase